MVRSIILRCTRIQQPRFPRISQLLYSSHDLDYLKRAIIGADTVRMYNGPNMNHYQNANAPIAFDSLRY